MDWTEHYDLGVDNRRRATRINREFPIQTLDDQERLGRGSAINVSATGARLVLTKPCRGEFTLQLDEQTQVLARPVWTRELSGFAVVGVEFQLTGEDQKRSLQGFLTRLAA